MENLTTPRLEYPKIKKLASQRTLVTVGIIITFLGIGGSFFLSNTVEKFFREARTKSVVEIVHEQVKHKLQKGDISNWQDPEVIGRLELFAKETKEYVPSASAIKVYTNDGILAWTDLKGAMPGYQKPESDWNLAKVRTNKQMIMTADKATKKELGKDELFEVWTTVESDEGEGLGYVEIYFDSSDIASFIVSIQYSVWGVFAIMLGVILFLISIAFRAQDKKIVEQSGYLNGIVEQSPIGIYTINTNGFIESYNPAMMKISGITDANETIGKNIFDAVAYRKNGLDKLLMSGLGGVAFETEVDVESSLGEHKKTSRHYHGVPLKNENGEVEHLLVMVEDITKRKELEKEVTLRAGDLEAKINERTKAIQEKIEELERFQRLTVDRELRMTELKQEIEKMRVKLEELGVKSFTV